MRITRSLGFVIALATSASLSAQPNTWVQRASIPNAAMYQATSFVIGIKAYVGTGTQASLIGNRNDFREYDASTNAWTIKAPLPAVGRVGAVGFSIGTKGYLGLGRTSQNIDLQDLWEYDPATDHWTAMANFPGGLMRAACSFTIGNKGYVCTGIVNGSVTNGLWEFDPMLNTWTSRSALPGAARHSAVAFAIGAKGYVATGADGTNNLNDLWEYDPVTDQWAPKAAMPVAGRYSAVGFAAGGSGYICSGADVQSTGMNDLWAYAPLSNTWSRKTDLPARARLGAVGFSIGTTGYISTGFDASVLLLDLWAYYADLPALTCSLTGAPFCFTVGVVYTASGPFNPGNTFTVQLSDATGSFASPLNIGTVTATTSGTINARLPISLRYGNGYRVRVVGSDPVVIGADNGFGFSVARPSFWFADVDGDGFGDQHNYSYACVAPPGHVSDYTDDCPLIPGKMGDPCDDRDPATRNDVINALCVCAGTPRYICQSTQLTTTANPIISAGAVLPFANTSFVWADDVTGANQYLFTFSNVTGQPLYKQSLASATRSRALGWTTQPPLQPGRTYWVGVQVSFSGGRVYCETAKRFKITIR